MWQVINYHDFGPKLPSERYTGKVSTRSEGVTPGGVVGYTTSISLSSRFGKIYYIRKLVKHAVELKEKKKHTLYLLTLVCLQILKHKEFTLDNIYVCVPFNVRNLNLNDQNLETRPVKWRDSDKEVDVSFQSLKWD